MPMRVYKRAHASLRIHGPNVDPLDVTLALKLPPDHVHRQGEPRLLRTRSGTVEERSPYQSGMWSMSSEQWVDSPQLAVHLEWLLTQLEPLADALSKFQRGGTNVDFICYSFGSSPQPPSLPRSIRNRAAALGIDIQIDHYAADGQTA